MSGLIMSFLLMVPEAASPSGPPSSRMSRTSAPVAIAPAMGGAPRGQGSVPEEGAGSDQGAEPLLPRWGRGGPGQVGIPSASRRLGLPKGPNCLLNPSASAPVNPRSRHHRSPISAKPRTETSGRAQQIRGRQEHFRSVLRRNGALRQRSTKATERRERAAVLGAHQPAGVPALLAFWHFLSTLHVRCIWGNEKSSQNFVTLEIA